MDTKLKNSDERVRGVGLMKNIWGVLIAFMIMAGVLGIVAAVYPALSNQTMSGTVDITSSVRAAENEENISYSFDGYVVNRGDKVVLLENHWRIVEEVTWLMLGVVLLTVMGAFITALIKPLGMTERKLFRAPLEVVALIGGLGIAAFIGDGVYSLLLEITWGTLNQELCYALAEQFYLNLQVAEGIMIGITFLIWLLMIATVYWVVTCLTAVFTIGPIRYIKERTLTGRFVRWIVRLVRGTYNLVDSVDFKDKSSRMLFKVVGVNFVILSIISCFWFFGLVGLLVYSVVLFFVLKKNYTAMQEKYEILLKATNELAEGNLDVEIKEELGVFEPFKDEIKKIQAGFKKAVDEEVKSQSMKTELITNVSHDLKTPLTAIITYVDLLKKEDITENERKTYIGVLDQKSMRLKHLIEDLFEVSKANSRNVTLNMMDVDIVSLMKQVRLELEDKAQETSVDFKWNLPEAKVILNLDSEKTYRVFENLIVNIIKYGMPGTRAYVDIESRENEVLVSFKNISATEISLNGMELSERFVRGDASRNTDGSGLGLAIAKSFVELQRGRFEVEIEADLFKVLLVWRRED